MSENKKGPLLVSIKIKGTTPLLMHRFTDEAAMTATEGSTTTMQGDRGTLLEQATKCLYLAEDNETIIIPQPVVFKTIVQAGLFFRVGGVKLTTQKSSLIPPAISLRELWYPLQFKEPWTIDSRPVVIPKTGGRITRHRPCFHD